MIGIASDECLLVITSRGNRVRQIALAPMVARPYLASVGLANFATAYRTSLNITGQGVIGRKQAVHTGRRSFEAIVGPDLAGLDGLGRAGQRGFLDVESDRQDPQPVLARGVGVPQAAEVFRIIDRQLLFPG